MLLFLVAGILLGEEDVSKPGDDQPMEIGDDEADEVGEYEKFIFDLFDDQDGRKQCGYVIEGYPHMSME